MIRIVSARDVAALSLVFAGIVSAQPPATTLPPTHPTTLPAIANPIPTAASTPQQDLPTPAQVSFADGKLHVVANSSSLNQILRQIARITSITITGGIKDERVFGTYGPAAPGEVLDDLLDGTDTNMLYRESTNTKPGELILTPRNGGPTPPNPNAAAFDNAPSTDFQRSPYYPPQNRPQPLSRPNPNGQSRPFAPATGAGTTNGQQSPQQIYQQLQRMQQAQPHP